jgi:hypothetical protein
VFGKWPIEELFLSLPEVVNLGSMGHRQRLVVLFLLLTLAFTLYAGLAVPPHSDDLAIFSTGLNLLIDGHYTEYFFSHTHRGPLGAVLNISTYFVLGLTWARNLVAGVASAAIVFLLVGIGKRVQLGSPVLNAAVFSLFAFVPYALNHSAIHLPQVASVLAVLWAVLHLVDAPKMKQGFIVGCAMALGTLIYTFNLIVFGGVIAFLAVDMLIRRDICWRSKLEVAAAVVAPLVAAVFVQMILVYATSGRFAMSNEPFDVFVTWNLRYGAEHFAGSPTFEMLTGEAAPTSYFRTALAFLSRPDVYISYYLAPTLRGLNEQSMFIETRLFWIPLLVVGLFGAKPTVCRLRYYGLIFSAVLPVLGWITLVYAPRFFMFAFVATVPIVVEGIHHTMRWCGDAVVFLGWDSDRVQRGVKGCVIALILLVCVGFNARELRRGNFDGANVIFDLGEYMTSDDAPSTGVRVYTSTAKPYLWNPNYRWKRATDLYTTSIHDTLSYEPAYLILESGDAEAIIPALPDIAAVTDSGRAVPHLVAGETIGFGHNVEAVFTRGNYTIWLIQLDYRDYPR